MSFLGSKEFVHSECKTDENAGFQQDFQSPENQSLGAVLEYTMSLPVSGKGDHLNECWVLLWRDLILISTRVFSTSFLQFFFHIMKLYVHVFMLNKVVFQNSSLLNIQEIYYI